MPENSWDNSGKDTVVPRRMRWEVDVADGR